MRVKRKQLEAYDGIPKFINKYILEYDHHLRMETKLLKIEPVKTRYDEWVVIAVEENDDGNPYVWITNFINKKVKNMFPMYLIIDNESLSIRIGDIRVLGDNRSKGYGALFMEELFEIVEVRKLLKISGCAERPGDPILINFYKKFGIEMVGNNLHWERV